MRTGGFDMRGAGEAVAVASSSPSKNTSALDVMRFQRINPDSLPLANGSGSGSSSSSASRKLPALAPRSSTDVVHDAPAVAADASRLASYLANTSLEQHKPRARAAAASSSAAAAALVIRDHVQQPSAAPNPSASTIGVAAADVSVRLQWGHNKRSRGRRESPATPAPAPPPETPAQARRRASLKIQRRNAAAAAAAASAEKLMPPPGARGGPVIRAASSLQPRPAAVAAADALYGRTTVALQHHRSAEEPRAGAGDPHPSAGTARQQQRPHRQATEKEKGKAPLVPEPPKQPQPQQQQQQAAGAGELQKLVVASRPEMPRIVTALTRKEKEEDFMAMKGTKLPPRPKKRNKAVEKAVCQICPGQWLSDVSRARYMVREKKSRKQKRGGGLKAMDSDSD